MELLRCSLTWSGGQDAQGRCLCQEVLLILSEWKSAEEEIWVPGPAFENSQHCHWDIRRPLVSDTHSGKEPVICPLQPWGLSLFPTRTGETPRGMTEHGIMPDKKKKRIKQNGRLGTSFILVFSEHIISYTFSFASSLKRHPFNNIVASLEV